MTGGTAGSLHLPAVPVPSPTRREQQERGDHRMRSVDGEQYAQVENADPFAPAVWRSPVHRTPEWIIWLVQLIRLLFRTVWFILRHPLLDVAARGAGLASGWVAGCHRRGDQRAWRPGHSADHVAGLVRQAGNGSGPVPVALVVVLPTPLARGYDNRRARPEVPGPGHT